MPATQTSCSCTSHFFRSFAAAVELKNWAMSGLTQNFPFSTSLTICDQLCYVTSASCQWEWALIGRSSATLVKASWVSGEAYLRNFCVVPFSKSDNAAAVLVSPPFQAACLSVQVWCKCAWAKLGHVLLIMSQWWGLRVACCKDSFPPTLLIYFMILHA